MKGLKSIESSNLKLILKHLADKVILIKWFATYSWLYFEPFEDLFEHLFQLPSVYWS